MTQKQTQRKKKADAAELSERSLRRWLKERRIAEVECLVPDITGNARGKIIPADVAVVGDVKRSLPLITERFCKRDHRQWIAGLRACDQIE
mgnify:CR=1 FL=1